LNGSEAATLATAAGSRASTATLAPAEARACAMAKPMPRVPPVTTAMQPLRLGVSEAKILLLLLPALLLAILLRVISTTSTDDDDDDEDNDYGDDVNVEWGGEKHAMVVEEVVVVVLRKYFGFKVLTTNACTHKPEPVINTDTVACKGNNRGVQTTKTNTC
jgi:hypothetical protein